MALTLRNSIVPLSPIFTLNENHRLRSCVLVRSAGGEDIVSISRESVRISGASSVNRNVTGVISYNYGGKTSEQDVLEELKTFWDDGYGTQTVKDCAEVAMDLIKNDKGPPRWFCPVTCGKPLKDSPLLLYLPGNWCSVSGCLIIMHIVNFLFLYLSV